MTTRPFNEGFNSLDVRVITNVSNSMDTSGIDPFRQGVELTQDKYFQQGIVKIWSGLPGHAVDLNEYGQRDDEIFPESTHFEEIDRFVPALYLTDYYDGAPIVIDSDVSTNENTMDGIIEPLTIRSLIAFSSLNVPFEPHSVKGNVEGGSFNSLRGASQIVSKYSFADLNRGEIPYEDNVDMTGGIPTNLGFWPAAATGLTGFDDAQLKDGVLVPAAADVDLIERVKGMTPATNNYLSTDYISSAALLHDDRDWTYTLPPPFLTSLNYSQGDPNGGGDRIVITGRNLSNTTRVYFGTTLALFNVLSNTQVSAVLPAGSVGFTTVSLVTSRGSSNSLVFEYWSPAQLSPRQWVRAPNYSDVGPGTWTDEGSLLDNFTNVANYPIAGIGLGNIIPTVDFNGANQTLTATTLISTVVGASFTMWVLFNARSVPANPAYNGNLIGDETNAEVGIGFADDGLGNNALSMTVLQGGASYQDSPDILGSLNRWNLAIGQVDSSDVGNEGKLSLNGSSWSTFVITGGYGASGPGAFSLGKGYAVGNFDGREADVGVVNGVVSANNIIKLRNYMNQRYGVTV